MHTRTIIYCQERGKIHFHEKIFQLRKHNHFKYRLKYKMRLGLRCNMKSILEPFPDNYGV